jgi:hypothetical protein
MIKQRRQNIEKTMYLISLKRKYRKGKIKNERTRTYKAEYSWLILIS